MKADPKFAKRPPVPIDCVPVVTHEPEPSSVCMTLIPPSELGSSHIETGSLRIKMTPGEAVQLGLDLIAAGNARLIAEGKM